MRVFLGGTCNGSTWRDQVMNNLHLARIDYFAPVDCQGSEKIKNLCDYHLYVITPLMTNLASLIDSIDMQNKNYSKVLLVVLNEDEGKVFTSNQIKIIENIKRIAHNNGSIVLNSLDDATQYLSNARLIELYPK